MTLSEILLSIVAGAATLTPLILGLLKYFGDKKDITPAESATAAPAPVPTLGDTVDYESLAMKAMSDQIALLAESITDLRARLRQADTDISTHKANTARAEAQRDAAEAQRDAAYLRLRDPGTRP